MYKACLSSRLVKEAMRKHLNEEPEWEEKAQPDALLGLVPPTDNLKLKEYSSEDSGHQSDQQSLNEDLAQPPKEAISVVRGQSPPRSWTSSGLELGHQIKFDHLLAPIGTQVSLKVHNVTFPLSQKP